MPSSPALSSGAPQGSPSLEELPSFITSPDLQDKLIWGFLAFTFVFALVLMPLRPFLLEHPWWAAALTGSRTGLVISGAHAAVYGKSWSIPLAMGVVSALKFYPVWWYMGKKWGREYIAMSLKNTPWVERRYPLVERLTRRWYPLLLASCFIPGNPFPTFILFLIMGEAGVRLWKFLLLSFFPLLLVQSLNVYLGYRFGEPVVQVVEEIAKYAGWISLAMVVWILWKGRRQAKEEAVLRREEAPAKAALPLEEAPLEEDEVKRALQEGRVWPAFQERLQRELQEDPSYGASSDAYNRFLFDLGKALAARYPLDDEVTQEAVYFAVLERGLPLPLLEEEYRLRVEVARPEA